LEPAFGLQSWGDDDTFAIIAIDTQGMQKDLRLERKNLFQEYVCERGK
jgi:hypothetical protein